MRRVGETPQQFRSYNTCVHRGRVFHFSRDGRRLRVTEVLLGDKATSVSTLTIATCKADDDKFVTCCSMGEHMLVMSGKHSDISAATLDVGDGPLSESMVHTTELIVKGTIEWSSIPYLCSLSDARILLYFGARPDMWNCELNTTAVHIRKLATTMPTEGGFCTVPLHTPDGKLFVAGASPASSDIMFITIDRDPTFEKIGSIPGRARWGASAILIGERFVLGFGGYNYNALDDLWVFDLETRKASLMRNEGDWHPGDFLVPMVVHGGTLYLLSGWNTTCINAVPLAVLSEWIHDESIRSAFRSCIQTLAVSQQAKLLSHIASLQETIKILSQQIAGLRAQNEVLQAERQGQPQPPPQPPAQLPGSILIQLPFSMLPNFTFPQKWRLDALGLERFICSMEVHHKDASHRRSLLKGYRAAFRPILEDGISRALFLAQAAVFSVTAKYQVASQVVILLIPGQLFSPSHDLLALSHLPSLRPEEKLLDSPAAERSLQILREEISVTKQVLALAPPSYGALLSSVNSHDPLRSDTSHSCTSKIRRLLQASRAIRASQQARGLDEAVRLLQKVQKQREQGYNNPEEGAFRYPWTDFEEPRLERESSPHIQPFFSGSRDYP